MRSAHWLGLVLLAALLSLGVMVASNASDTAVTLGLVGIFLTCAFAVLWRRALRKERACQTTLPAMAGNVSGSGQTTPFAAGSPVEVAGPTTAPKMPQPAPNKRRLLLAPVLLVGGVIAVVAWWAPWTTKKGAVAVDAGLQVCMAEMRETLDQLRFQDYEAMHEIKGDGIQALQAADDVAMLGSSSLTKNELGMVEQACCKQLLIPKVDCRPQAEAVRAQWIAVEKRKRSLGYQ